MAKTIKEMAVEYSKKYRHIICRCTGRKSYEVGATEVLKEIENMLPDNDRCLNDYGNALVWRIRERIKELNGDLNEDNRIQ